MITSSRLLALGLSGLLALTGLACDTTQTATANTDSAAVANTESSTSTESMEPGQLWRTAAAVHDTLSDEQFAQMEERLRNLSTRFSERGGLRANRPGRGMHGGRGMHRGRPGMGGPGMNGPGMGGPGPDGPSGGLWAELDLTDEQKESIAEIRAEYRPQIRDLMQQRRDGSITDEDFRAQMQALRTAMHEAVRGVLTDEQREILDARRAEREALRDEVRAIRAEVLGLTAEQEEQLTALRSDPDAHPRLMEDYDAWKASLAEILNEEQVEIVVVHAALRAKLRAERMENRGPGFHRSGPRGGRFGG